LKTDRLLSAAEPAPFELVEGSGDIGLILVCDHASHRIPQSLGTLGVADVYLNDHIGWDIGAAAITRLLQARFRVDAVLANYSRLVIDLNRSLTDASLIPAISDGVLIPGNLGLSTRDRAARASALHAPYHAAIEALIERRSGGGRVPVFIGIHSFTPRFHGTLRPWHAGVLWDRDPRLAVRMLAALRREPGLFVGDNEPYSGRHPADYSIDTHAETRGLAHVGIEIRQDLIGDAPGQARWAGRLGDILETLLADESLFRPLSPVNPVA